MQEHIDLLVSGGTVLTQNPAREIIAGGAVAIDGSRIVAIGPSAELDARYEARRRIDAAGRYVFPGLINTHTHLYQTFMKGLGEGLPLYQWIDEITAPSTVAMTPREGYLSALLGGIEALRSGTTTVLDFMLVRLTGIIEGLVVDKFNTYRGFIWLSGAPVCSDN